MIKAQGILLDKGMLADNTRKLEIRCQEILPEDLLEILKSHGKLGWFVFNEAGINDQDIPDETIEFKGDKSPGQRLRSVIYVY